MEKRGRRIVWYGDGPDTNSGFGTVTREILKGLETRGWRIQSVFGINSPGVQNNNFGYPIYSAQAPYNYGIPDHDPYGRVRFLEHLQRGGNFDVLVMLQDSFTLNHIMDMKDNDSGEMRQVPFVQIATEIARKKGAKTVVYFPIDATPWGDWFSGLDAADKLVTYTDWGIREIEAVYPPLSGQLSRVYHGAEPKFFAETKPKMSKTELKERWIKDHKDRFICLWVGANQRRKRLDLVLKTFRHFLDNYEKNATLILRTAVQSPQYGWDLHRLIALYELTPDQVIMVGQDISREGLRELYHLSDAFLYPSMEGCGLTVTEAMASRLPCVLADHSSLSEIGRGRAWMVPMDKGNPYTVMPQDNEVRRLNWDCKEAARLLNNVKENPQMAQMQAERAFQWCEENSWDVICEQWDDLLRDVLFQ